VDSSRVLLEQQENLVSSIITNASLYPNRDTSLNRESIENVLPGLEDWQYYGPSTRRGEIVYLHNFAEPQVSVVVRGVKVARLKSAKVLGSQEELSFTLRTAINDSQLPDPDGEIIIDVRGDKVTGLMPVIVLDFGGDPASVQIRNW
jgi:alpha-L-fucosidase